MIDLNALNFNQKECLNRSLNLILIKGLYPREVAVVDKNFNQFLSGKTPTDILLNKLLTIVFEEMPPRGKFKKWKDCVLEQRVLALFEKIQKIETEFTNWKKEIDTSLEVYKLTLPNHQPYREKLKTLEDHYVEMIQESVNPALNDAEDIDSRLIKRTNTWKKQMPSDEALNLVAHCQQITIPSLRTNIENFTHRTTCFKALQVTLSEKIITMNKTISTFENAFNYLSHLIANNKKNTGVNATHFNLNLWSIGSLKRPEPRLQAAAPLQPAPAVAFDPLKDEKPILNLIQTLLKKEPLVISQEDSPIQPVLQILLHWTPCGIATFKEDRILETEMSQLNEKIRSSKETISSWIQLLNDEFVTPEKTESLYIIHNENLIEIAKEYTDLINKIQTRINTDNKHDISESSLKLFSCSHDISPDALELNLKHYRERTLLFEAREKDLKAALKEMNQLLITYKKLSTK